MDRFEPIVDADGREVSVSQDGVLGRKVGIHSWQNNAPWIPEDDPRAREASKSIFFDLENAKRVRDMLTHEIEWIEGKRHV